MHIWDVEDAGQEYKGFRSSHEITILHLRLEEKVLSLSKMGSEISKSRKWLLPKARKIALGPTKLAISQCWVNMHFLMEMKCLVKSSSLTTSMKISLK